MGAVMSGHVLAQSLLQACATTEPTDKAAALQSQADLIGALIDECLEQDKPALGYFVMMAAPSAAEVAS